MSPSTATLNIFMTCPTSKIGELDLKTGSNHSRQSRPACNDSDLKLNEIFKTPALPPPQPQLHHLQFHMPEDLIVKSDIRVGLMTNGHTRSKC